MKLMTCTIASLALGATALSLSAAQAAMGGAPAYAIIQWDGPHNTQVIWPDGKVDFLPAYAPEALSRPDHANDRGYIMTILINKVAQQGYDYVGMADGEEVVMKKVR